MRSAEAPRLAIAARVPPELLRRRDRKIKSSPTTRQSSPMASQVRLPVMKLPLMNRHPDQSRRTDEDGESTDDQAEPYAPPWISSGGSSLSGDSEQAVVVGCRITSAVGVGVGQQQTISVDGDLHSPQPAIISTEVRDRIAGLRAIKRNLPEPFPAQSRHPQVALPVRQPGRRGISGTPDDLRVGHSSHVAGALDLRPSVVGTLSDQVQLVPGLLPELAGPQAVVIIEGEPLDVAMAVAEDLIVERVAWRGSAVESQFEDLPAE